MQELQRSGLAMEPLLHSYHCDCSSCRYDNGYAFRGQRDSSCSGEIISRPFDTLIESLDAMVGLQEAAVKTDAVPGWSAGFHVHVNIQGRTMNTRGRALWQFLRWEDTLRYIAAGRFPNQRSNNNRVIDCLGPDLRCLDVVAGAPWAARPDRYTFEVPDLAWCETEMNDVDLDHLRRWLYEAHIDSDRHSNLNVNTQHGTWEFRLWNSTRAAWRMQLFVGLSQAFVTTDVIAGLENVTEPLRAVENNAVLLGSVLNDSESFGPIAELLDRQLAFHSRTGGTDAALTCL